ncbi:hypothetical protein [Chitinimonas koreensis]|uniref:hypothetical protein n=1 Tax=Chitinimonas koreensis TaxID=356302 RepID=UPI000429D081|nr:hypothetical protein [Chitinimonas koreensis]QNM98104.1 hypothetical protein H9L41_07585 [Chitinimonas koreensis]
MNPSTPRSDPDRSVPADGDAARRHDLERTDASPDSTGDIEQVRQKPAQRSSIEESDVPPDGDPLIHDQNKYVSDTPYHR